MININLKQDNLDNCCDGVPICGSAPVEGFPPTNTLRKVLLEILNLVRNSNVIGFNVDLEITLRNGLIKTINFSTLNQNSIIITHSTIKSNDLVISLCDIVKIKVLSSSLIDTTFRAALENILRGITTSCDLKNHRREGRCFNEEDKCRQCSQEMQDYIEKNKNHLESLSHNGSFAEVREITTIGGEPVVVSVLENATLENTYNTFLSDATLNLENINVTKEVTATNSSVVQSIDSLQTSVLQNLTSTNVTASGPITSTEKSVITDITTTTSESIPTNLTATTDSVIKTVTATTDTAITGFNNPTSVNGVISGLDTVSNITPIEVTVPEITSVGTGPLQLILAANSIAPNIPPTDITLGVTVGGEAISFTGNSSRYVLPSGGTILGGGTTTPLLTTINNLGVPVLGEFANSINVTTSNVINTITTTPVEGSLVTNITKDTITDIETPTEVTAIGSITTTPVDISSVDTVTSIPASQLFNSTTETVLSNAAIQPTYERAVANTSLAKTNVNINNYQTESLTVYTPSEVQVTGDVSSVGDGLTVVGEQNGDLSIYSIYDINSINI